MISRAIEFETFLTELVPSGKPGSGTDYLTRYIEAIENMYNTFNDFGLFYNGEKNGFHQFTILIPQRHRRWYDSLINNLEIAAQNTFQCKRLNSKAMEFIDRVTPGVTAITVLSQDYDSDRILFAMIRACSESFTE